MGIDSWRIVVGGRGILDVSMSPEDRRHPTTLQKEQWYEAMVLLPIPLTSDYAAGVAPVHAWGRSGRAAIGQLVAEIMAYDLGVEAIYRPGDRSAGEMAEIEQTRMEKELRRIERGWVHASSDERGAVGSVMKDVRAALERPEERL